MMDDPYEADRTWYLSRNEVQEAPEVWYTTADKSVQLYVCMPVDIGYCHFGMHQICTADGTPSITCVAWQANWPQPCLMVTLLKPRTVPKTNSVMNQKLGHLRHLMASFVQHVQSWTWAARLIIQVQSKFKTLTASSLL